MGTLRKLFTKPLLQVTAPPSKISFTYHFRCTSVILFFPRYVSYGKVESILKTCPIVENICLYADPAKDYLIAIVIPDKVHLEAVNHSGADKTAIIQKMILEYGIKNGLEKFELPLKILLITKDEWTPETGLVTAAFKIRRKQVVARYQQEIDLLYI